MTKKGFLHLLLTVFLLLVMTGCSSTTDPAKANSTDDQTAQSNESETESQSADEVTVTDMPMQKLRIGVMSDVGAVPFIIAEQQGYFANRGLDIEIQIFRSALDRDTALQTGNLDGAMADMLTIIFFNDADFDVKMVAQTYGNYKMVTSPKLDIDEFLALDEISIGLSSNTVIDFATQKIAQSKEFESKLSKVAIPQMPVRLEMLKAGELSGATLPDPLASAAVLDGGTFVAGTEDFNLFPGIFIMTTQTIENNRTAATLMYEAYNEAVNYLSSTPSDEYFDVLIEKAGFPPVLKGQFEMPKFTLVKAPDQYTFDETLAWMKNQGLTTSTVLYEDITDLSLLPIQ